MPLIGARKVHGLRATNFGLHSWKARRFMLGYWGQIDMIKVGTVLNGKTRLFAGSGLAALSLAAFATPAYAQDADEPEIEEVDVVETEAPEAGNLIIVSGSRIARPNLDAASPITTVAADEILDGAEVSLGDALNDLPSLRSTFSQANSNRFIGTSGLNLLDLRGLGTNRTLVLINGRRQVGALPGDFRIDVNTIPAALLDRIDVITGGKSAIYGSEAVAGVVNFVLRDDFEGIEIDAQASITGRGDRDNQFISVAGGKNFADGRGNIAIVGEYARQTALFNTERDAQTGAFSGRRQFNRTTAGVGQNTFTFFQSGVRNGNITDGTNILGLSCQENDGDPTDSAALQDATCATDANGLVRNPQGALEEALYAFDNNGRLVRNIPQIDFRRAGSNNTLGGIGSTLSNTGQLAPGLDRYNVNMLAKYEFSDAFEVFAEAKYNRLDALQEGQPTFRFFDEVISYDNAFLNPDDAVFIRDTLAPAFTGGTGFFYSRFNVDLGGRSEVNERETYRIVGGVRGDFNSDWRYEIAANYSRLDTFLTSRNQIIEQNFTNAVDAVFDGTGNIVCAINADADTTNDDAACAPINLLGVGSPSQAAIDYVAFDATRDERAEQFVVSGFVSGDSSQLFELPGGPIGFSVGAEYREETSFSEFDELTQSGATFLNAIPTFDPPKFTEKSVFGELLVPLLADMPFVNELTFEGAARYSDYNTAADKVFTWNAGVIYSPVESLRLRGNFSKSVRVPNPGDLFSAPSQNFAFLADPCDTQNINTEGSNRIANCTSIGLGPDQNFINVPARAQSLSFLSGGNPLLAEEESESYTIGAVFEPVFLPGFAMTIDYYNISITNVIAAVGAQQVLENCFDADPSNFPNNNFCPSINPRGADGFFADPVLIGGSFNFAALETEGVDIDLRYTHNFDNGNRLSLRTLGTYVFRNIGFLDIANPDEPDRFQSELGDPTFAANFSADWEIGALTLNYDVRYVGRQLIQEFEDEFAFNGEPANNPLAYGQRYYGDVFYNDIRIDYEVNDQFTFFAGVDNALDELPPLGLSGAGADSAVYDNFGRTFFAGFSISR